MKSLIYIFLAIAFALLFTTVLLSQPPAPMDPTQAPIDGGLGVLAAAGAGYAIKKLKDRKNRALEKEQNL